MPEQDKPPGPTSQALAEGKWNPLFVGVLAALALAIAAGAIAGPSKPASAFHSNIVFRVEVALVVAVALYWSAAALWLAWHQTIFKKFGLGNAGAEPPEPKEVQKREDELEVFVHHTTDTLANLAERIEALENKAGSRP